MDLLRGKEEDKATVSESNDYYFHIENRIAGAHEDSCINTKISSIQCYKELNKAVFFLVNQFFGMNAHIMKLILWN